MATCFWMLYAETFEVTTGLWKHLFFGVERKTYVVQVASARSSQTEFGSTNLLQALSQTDRVNLMHDRELGLKKNPGLHVHWPSEQSLEGTASQSLLDVQLEPETAVMPGIGVRDAAKSRRWALGAGWAPLIEVRAQAKRAMTLTNRILASLGFNKRDRV